jgi:hypothetical protein
MPDLLLPSRDPFPENLVELRTAAGSGRAAPLPRSHGAPSSLRPAIGPTPGTRHRSRNEVAVVFELLSEASREMLIRAREEVQMLRHTCVGTEHLLLGIASDADGRAVGALVVAGVTVAALRERLESVIGVGLEETPPWVPFTPRAAGIMPEAAKIARSWGRREIEPEHLLAAILDEGQGLGIQLLGALGVGSRCAAPQPAAAWGPPPASHRGVSLLAAAVRRRGPCRCRRARGPR